MTITKDLETLEALRALYTMLVTRVELPHGDCESVAPTFNVCNSCKNHSYCANRQRFLLHLDNLDQLAEG